MLEMQETYNTSRSERSDVLIGLDHIRPIYWLPKDNLAAEALIPCFAAAEQVDSMMGFFSSESLTALAPGLATFIDNPTSPFRLIVCPLLKQEDQAALKEGVSQSDAAIIAANALRETLNTEDFIKRHTLKCLAWLLAAGRIEIKIALMREGLFHPKVWLFYHGQHALAAHGSNNATGAGLQKNIEQVAIARSWNGADENYTIQTLQNKFKDLWNDQEADCVVVNMPEAVRQDLLRDYKPATPPTEEDLNTLYHKAAGMRGIAETAADYASPEFAIPASLEYRTGAFAHQSAAVQAWLDNDCRGVLEMATGSGKTITAMICAKKLAERINKPLLILVAAPYVPLIEQWRDEIEPFGLKPRNIGEAGGAKARARLLGRIKRQIRRHGQDVQAIVVSHDALCNPHFQETLSNFGCATLLIADEVHNLGRAQFVEAPPDFFDYRLGLSATPARQYDAEGTADLFAYFGDVVYKYGLDEAIGNCLVPYDYYVHPVELTADELEEWNELSDKIRAQAWREKEEAPPSEYLAKLLRDRRAALENAANKVAELRRLLALETRDSLRHTLIYASDKNPTQLEDVNRLLDERGVLYHQLTAKETSNRRKTNAILQDFQQGTLQVLTAKRVLDEGVNIPQVRKAYILASTTVARQWTQRHGRLLRRCDAIGKMYGEIHDFVALPPADGYQSADDRAIYRSELSRAQEFARLARNAGSADGPLDTIMELIRGAAL